MPNPEIPALAKESLVHYGNALELIKQDQYTKSSLQIDVAISKIDRALTLKAADPKFDHQIPINDALLLSLDKMGEMIQIIGESLKILKVSSGESIYNKLVAYFNKVCGYFDQHIPLPSIY